MNFKAIIEKRRTTAGVGWMIGWYMFVALVLIIGLSIGCDSYDSWFGHHWRFGFYERFISNYGFDFVPFIIEFSAIILLISVPIIIRFINKSIVKRLSLTLSEDKVSGTYGKFSTKTLSLPIDQLSGISVIDSFFDKIRSGKTLSIGMSSGTICIPFVQNADEFANAVINCINSYKKQYGKSEQAQQQELSIHSAPAAYSGSSADEIKKYKELLDSGIITQEEFDAKKKQLLGL